jgi:hypothetical protein
MMLDPVRSTAAATWAIRQAAGTLRTVLHAG